MNMKGFKMNLLSYTWELIINILEALLFFVLMNKKLNRKTSINTLKPKQYIFLCLQILLLSLFNYMNISTIISVITLGSLHFVFALFFYSDTIHKKLFWVVIYTIISIFSDGLTLFIPQLFFGIDELSLLMGGSLRTPFTLLYISIFTLFIFLLIILSNGNISLHLGEKVTFSILSIMAICTEQLILIELVNAEIHMTNSNTLLILIIIFFLCMFLFLAFLFFVYRLGISREYNLQLLKLQALQEMEEKQYIQTLQSISELRTLKHDMGNHLSVLSSMCQNRQYDNLSKYIETFNQQIENSHHMISSGNTPVDCIVTAKLGVIQKHHITVEYSIHLPEKLPIDDIKIWIYFKIRPYNGMLIINCENSSDGNYNYASDGSLLSTKTTNKTQNHQYFSHGLGINRIKTIAKDCNGFTNIVSCSNKFTITVMLPLPEEL